MDEEGFPRGTATPAVVKARKAEDTERVERKKKRKEGGKMEELFVNGEEPVVSKKKKKTKQLTDEENRELAGRGRKEQRSFEVLPLTYDTIVKDMLTLGVVEQIHDTSMLIVMPGRTTGIVEINSVSKPFTKQLEKAAKKGTGSYHTLADIFSVGQVVTAKVKDVGVLDTDRGHHHNIQLSLDPKDLHANWSAKDIQEGVMMVGAVKSREDNGWQVDLGIKDVTAFMPENEGKMPNKQELLLGQLLYVKVIKVISNGRAVQVSMLPKKAKSQNDLQPGGINYSLLLPGMTLHSFVEEANETGLKLNADNLTALCHVDHLSEDWANPLSKTYAPPKNLIVKVLYIHPNLTTPYVTTRHNLIPLRTTLTSMKDDKLIEEFVKVQVASTSDRGVVVRVGDQRKPGLLPLSSLGEGLFTCKEDIDRNFKRKYEFECRVMKYSPFENMYICSLKKLVLETTYLRESKVPAGTMVKCTVTKLNEHGVAVTLDSNLEGFVPRLFMKEETFNLLNKKQKTWEKQRSARVMEFDHEKNRLVLTLNKELVKSSGKVIKSVDDAQVGNVGDGIVLRVESNGVLLKTIGGLKGFIPKKNFKEIDFYKKVSFMEHLSPGSVLSYQVVKVEKDKGQLLLKPVEDELEVEEEPKVESEEINDDGGKKRKAMDSDLENQKPERKRRKKKKNQSGDEEQEVLKTEEVKTEEMEVDAVEEVKDVKMKMKLDTDKFWDEGSNTSLPEGQSETIQKKKLDKKEKANNKKKSVEDNTIVALTKEIEKRNLTSNQNIGKLVEAYEKGTFSKEEEARGANFWIRLMEHYQKGMQYDKVRKVARDGLDYTPIAQQRDLREAMKIWRKLFLFVFQFGKEADAENVLKEAIERTDRKYECFKMAAESYKLLGKGKFKHAEKLYRERITKECGDQVEGWINFAKLYFDGKNVELARNVFHQATQSKFAESQPNFITDLTYRFAILEFYQGDKDKAEEMFRTVLNQHPKRVDIWNVYAQSLIKMKLYDRARSVFQELFQMSWKPNKIKGMLEQYKKFETEHGTPESKAMMKEVIERTLNLSVAVPADVA